MQFVVYHSNLLTIVFALPLLCRLDRDPIAEQAAEFHRKK